MSRTACTWRAPTPWAPSICRREMAAIRSKRIGWACRWRGCSDLLLGHIKRAEAHLVGRALAPVDVLRRELHVADPGLIGLAVVPVALDRQLVARLERLGLAEPIRHLPVEVPLLDVEQALLLAAPVVDLQV